MPNKYPTPCIAVILTSSKDGSILLGPRLKGSWRGTHCLPGGKMEFGESPLEGAYRELEEETGFKKNQVGILSPFPFVDSVLNKKNDYHMVTMFFWGTTDQEPPVYEESGKLGQFRFYDTSSLPDQLMASTQRAIDHFIKTSWDHEILHNVVK